MFWTKQNIYLIDSLMILFLSLYLEYPKTISYCQYVFGPLRAEVKQIPVHTPHGVCTVVAVHLLIQN
jgi:hypothetical protein